MSIKRFKGNLGYLVAGLIIFAVISAVYIEIKYHPEVKKSSFGLCHSLDSPYYRQIINYTPYEDLDSCLTSGGREPNGPDNIGNCKWRHTSTP